MRVSDADRERVVERLRAAAGEGRLDAAELEERVEAALAARTDAELEPLVADLPPERPRRRPRASAWTPLIQVGVLCVAIWAVTGAGYFWPMWVVGPWALFMLGPKHACGTRHRHRRTATPL